MGEAHIKHIKQVNWPEISSKVQFVHPEIWSVLDQIMSEASKQGRSKRLIVADYPYGQLLVDKGQFCLPCDTEQTEHALCPECENIAPTIKYSPIPLGLVLDESVEVFIDLDEELKLDKKHSAIRQRLVPLRMLSTGELFGVFETLAILSGNPDPAKPLFSVSSGARSVVIACPVREVQFLGRVKTALGLPKDMLPRKGNWLDWQFIQCVIQAKSPSKDWRAQVLILPDWVKEDSGPLTPLRHILQETGLDQMAPLQNYAIEEANMAGIYMSKGADGRETIKDEFYYYSTVRHILSISKGDMPAFFPVTPQSQAGPFFEFQEIMGAKGIRMPWYPVLLEPHRLTKPDNIGYYSVNRPSLLAPVPKNFLQMNRKAFLEQIGIVLSRLPTDMRERAKLNWEETTFYSVKGTTSTSERVRHIQHLAQTEFLPTSISDSPKISPQFSLNSDFFVGVVRIVRK